VNKSRPAIDVAKAVLSNQGYAAQDLWTDRFAQIVKLLELDALATEAGFALAVAAWQSGKPPLKVDGVLGPGTWKRLEPETRFSTPALALPLWLGQCVGPSRDGSVPLFKPPLATAILQPASFPLAFVPKFSYHKSKGHSRWFGADREHGQRWHAGCDLIADEGTKIYAVDEGEVKHASAHGFYTKTNKETGKVIFDVGSVVIIDPAINLWTFQSKRSPIAHGQNRLSDAAGGCPQ
jgi:murein DD-endopeptidase MepM/ murein hydrolase activator NlpD